MCNRTEAVLSLQNLKRQREAGRRFCPSWLCRMPEERKKIHLAGLGDVGRTTLTGLALLGGDVIDALGIYDLQEAQVRRLELELNQIYDPFGGRRIPPVYGVKEEDLFDCDVFVFCVAKQVPAIGKEQEDVRMAQFEANRKIVSWYAQKAGEAGYQGLFLVMSDPVELLCKEVLLYSRRGRNGLMPEQVQGCGLGVMNARAVYFARREERFQDFLTEGRVFGSHGRELVVANSILTEHYDEERSVSLTEQVIRANLLVRDVGFKPYIAPAVSSGALTILRVLKGEWNYSSNYLGGIYFGGKNRTTECGVEWEEFPLPPALFHRRQESYRKLENLL